MTELRAHSEKPTNWQLVLSHSLITQEVLDHKYDGSGTEDDPFVVEFIPDDPRNPMLFKPLKKWCITVLIGVSTLAVAFNSSAYSGGVQQVIEEFGVSNEVVTLGVSLFVLGFALGPLAWGPISELYGRQITFALTYGVLTVFNAGAAGSQNIETLLILRFLAGAFGSSPLTNAGGVIADTFSAKQRGLAMALFAVAPFMGPAIGPIVGGFVGETVGWRWLEGVLAIFSGVLWILVCLTVPETYAPVLLRKRALDLSSRTGKVYVSTIEAGKPKRSVVQTFKTALGRPWILLLREPIVLIMTIYMAIIYGTLYMMFGAFPIVYQEQRGWSQGIGGLTFIGVAIGFLAGTCYVIPDNDRFSKIEDKAIANGAHAAPPEARLPPAITGSILLPLGLFWFAWTNFPSIHWSVSILAGIPFGAGMLLVFLSIMNYLIDSYTIYAASVLAANSVLRSLFGAGFPLFTTYMYQNLGIHWASSVPAFLALACVPFPFLLYKYGPTIRRRCKFAREAEEEMIKLKKNQRPDSGEEEDEEEEERRVNGEKDLDRDVEKGTKEELGPAFVDMWDHMVTETGTDNGPNSKEMRAI